jgi:hypothetical protein
VFLKTIVVTRKKAPRFAQKVVKSMTLTSAAEVILHHKPPDGTIVIDATVIESLEMCLKIISHHVL